MIQCTHCGSENDEKYKFCGNCGAELQSSAAQKQDNQAEGVLSSGETVPVYEKITDAEEQKPEPILSQDANTNPYYDAQSPQYYSSNQNELKQEGGKNGFSIASMVCGILSITICCTTGIFGLILAVAAIALGIIALYNKYDGKGMAIAGIITGGIGFIIAGFLIFFGLWGMGVFNEFWDAHDIYF